MSNRQSYLHALLILFSPVFDHLYLSTSFPGDSDGICLQCWDLGSVPVLWRSAGEGNGNPLQYSCLENSMDRGAWQAISMGLQRAGHDWATNTHTHTYLSIIFSLLWPWVNFVLYEYLYLVLTNHSYVTVSQSLVVWMFFFFLLLIHSLVRVHRINVLWVSVSL